MDNNNVDEPVSQPMRPSAGVLTVGAIVLLALGAGAGRMSAPHSTDGASTPAPVDLDVACVSRVEASTAKLDAATGKVGELSSQIDAKQREIESLEQEIATSKVASEDQTRRLSSVRAELAELRTQLRTAETDRLNLTATVAVQDATLQDQSQQIDTQLRRINNQLVALSAAQRDAVDASWTAFTRGAQIQICEQGNRAALGRCHEAVLANLAPVEAGYRACVSMGAATPTLHESKTADERLPEFSQWIGKDDRVTQGWYTLLCDPTLPEAGQRAQRGVTSLAE